MTHGTLTAYVYFKCRCTTCRLYWNAYHTKYRQARRAEGRCVKCPAKSGSFARCEACREKEGKANLSSNIAAVQQLGVAADGAA